MIKKLLAVVKDKPDLEVKFLVAEDGLCDDYIYTEQQITSVRVEPWILFDHTEYDTRIFTDYENFLEHVVDTLELYENDEQAKQAFPETGFPDCIVVRLGSL